jgi:hypothetical protein
MADTIEVVDRGERVRFSIADVMKYHGPSSPGGVAHAFKVLERALALLDPDGPCERREIVIETAFGGPGARDGFEMVTRAVTGDRFRVDPALARPERGRALEAFVFRLSYRDRSATLTVREGFVTDESSTSRGPSTATPTRSGASTRSSARWPTGCWPTPPARSTTPL